MPEEILYNWKYGVHLEDGLGNIINNSTFVSIHRFIIYKINEFHTNEKINDNERELLFNDYYNNIIYHDIFNAICNIRNSRESGRGTKKSDTIDLGLPMKGPSNWNLLILGKFPGNDTLEQRNNGFGHSYFLNKENWFWHLLNHLYGGGNEIIKNIDEKNFKDLSKKQDGFLNNNHIALWDMVHLCYSVYGSSTDEDRIPISYSKIGEKLLERLEYNENMNLNIVIWGNRKKGILKYGSMTYLDFMKINDDRLDLSADFMEELRNMGAKNIEISETQYKNFLINQEDNVFTVCFNHNGFKKKFHVILGYDSSGSALKRKKWKRNVTGYNEFFNRQKFFWENFGRNN